MDNLGHLDQIRFNWQENFDQTKAFVGRPLRPAGIAHIRSWVERYLDRNSDRLADRIRQGHMIDGHGDTRCESICVVNGICFFDCVEFNDRFRCGDTASEIAFLAMDLDTLGRPDLGYYAAERYQAYAGDETLAQVMPCYRCYRAYGRGKAHSFALGETEFTRAEKERASELATNYFDWA